MNWYRHYIGSGNANGIKESSTGRYTYTVTGSGTAIIQITGLNFSNFAAKRATLELKFTSASTAYTKITYYNDGAYVTVGGEKIPMPATSEETVNVTIK